MKREGVKTKKQRETKRLKKSSFERKFLKTRFKRDLVSLLAAYLLPSGSKNTLKNKSVKFELYRVQVGKNCSDVRWYVCLQC